MIDQNLDMYVEFVNSSVPSLSAVEAVAFGLVCFGRQRLVYENLADLEIEKKLLSRIRKAEEEWWGWSIGGPMPQIVVSNEVHEYSRQVQPNRNRERVIFWTLSTCEALFSGLEEEDYWCTKYTAQRNIDMINSLEDELDSEYLNRLIIDEISRQESELLILADGVSTETRMDLEKVSTSQFLFEGIMWTDKIWKI